MNIKLIKNTTNARIALRSVGVEVPASGTYLLEVSEHTLWATPDSIAEISPFINSGDIIVNNGLIDLIPADAIRYLEYPDRLRTQKDDADVTQVVTVINFEGDNVAVANDGNGKSTVTISDDHQSGLHEAECVLIPGCGHILNNFNLLVDHTYCFIKEEDC